MIKKAYLGLLLLVCSMAYGQEGVPVYMDYFADNLYLLHPSMAGGSSSDKIRLTARQQWFDHSRAPNLQTLSYNGRVGESSGIGAIVFNDQNGYHSQIGGYLTYAHHLMLGGSYSDLNQLSFGINAGMVQSRLDETYFDPTNFDPVIAGIIQSTSYFNIDVGASYNLNNLSVHLTVKNLLFQNRDMYTETFESNNQRRYIASTSYTIAPNRSDWMYEPSVLFQWAERTGEKAVDVNFKVYRKLDFGRIWAGLSYRRSFDGAEYLKGNSVKTQKLQYLTPVLGVNYGNFMVAYTYSYQTGDVLFDNGGYHQITLGYDFGNRGRSNRFSCDCPAVN